MTILILACGGALPAACSSSSNTGGGSTTDGGASSVSDSGSAGNDGASTSNVSCSDVCNNLKTACAAAYTSDCVSQCQAQNGSNAELSCAATATSCAAVQACQSQTQIAYGGACTCASLSGSPLHCTNTACANPNGDYACFDTSGDPNNPTLICTEPCIPSNDNCPGNSTCTQILNGDNPGSICIPN